MKNNRPPVVSIGQGDFRRDWPDGLDPYSARMLAREIEKERRGSAGYQVLRALLFVVALIGLAVVLMLCTGRR